MARPSLVSHHASPRVQNRPSVRCRWRLSSMCRSPARPNVRSAPGSTVVSSPQKSTCSRRSVGHVQPSRPSDGERARSEVHGGAGLQQLALAGLDGRDLAARVRHDERSIRRSAIGDEDVPALVADLEVAARDLVAVDLDASQVLPRRRVVPVGVAPDEQLVDQLDLLAVVEAETSEARSREVDHTGAGWEQLATAFTGRRRRRVRMALAAAPGGHERATFVRPGPSGEKVVDRERGQRHIGIDGWWDGRWPERRLQRGGSPRDRRRRLVHVRRLARRRRRVRPFHPQLEAEASGRNDAGGEVARRVDRRLIREHLDDGAAAWPQRMLDPRARSGSGEHRQARLVGDDRQLAERHHLHVVTP